MVRRLILLVGLLVMTGAGCGDQAADAPQEEAQATADSQTTADAAGEMNADGAAEKPSTEREEKATEMKKKSKKQVETTPASTPAQPSDRTLTDAQKKRIGPRLQRLIRGKDPGMRPVESVGQREEASVYEVIIQSDDAEALRKAGIPLGTVQGNLMTARLTIDQILKAATIEAVGSIQAATKQQMHEQKPEGLQRQSPKKQNGGR